MVSPAPGSSVNERHWPNSLVDRVRVAVTSDRRRWDAGSAERRVPRGRLTCERMSFILPRPAARRAAGPTEFDRADVPANLFLLGHGARNGASSERVSASECSRAND
jgi:hypothetical protein